MRCVIEQGSFSVLYYIISVYPTLTGCFDSMKVNLRFACFNQIGFPFESSWTSLYVFEDFHFYIKNKFSYVNKFHAIFFQKYT